MVKQYLIMLAAVLITSSMSIVSCNKVSPHADDNVIDSLNNVVRAQALPERQDYMRYWSTQTILGKVKHIDKDIYEVAFPDMQQQGIEIWRIDIKSMKIMPANAGSLFSAFYLFCNDRNDQRGD